MTKRNASKANIRYLPFAITIPVKKGYNPPAGWVQKECFKDLEFTYFNELRPRKVRVLFSTWMNLEGFETLDPHTVKALEVVKFHLCGGPRGGFKTRRLVEPTLDGRGLNTDRRGLWRTKAAELTMRGLNRVEIAKQLGVTLSAVHQWAYAMKKLGKPYPECDPGYRSFAQRSRFNKNGRKQPDNTPNEPVPVDHDSPREMGWVGQDGRS